MKHAMHCIAASALMLMAVGCEKRNAAEPEPGRSVAPTTAPAAADPPVSQQSSPQTQSSTEAPITAYLDPPRRPSIRPQGPTHSRPLVTRDGRTLLWANGQPGTANEQWFDMTDSLINPAKFQYGIGKDSIPSIEEPQFLDYGDEQLSAYGISDQTQVIGFEYNGIARAYPTRLLNQHEVVNDEFDGVPFAVCW